MMIEKTYLAGDATLHEAMSFIEGELEKVDCPMKTMIQISVCVEEIYVNIAHYAYGGNDKGDVVVGFDYKDGVVTISFTDTGIAFDPLAKEDPDITLSVAERGIGGLGIFMVKKSMDEVSYERIDDKNIFTMKKKIN